MIKEQIITKKNKLEQQINKLNKQITAYNKNLINNTNCMLYDGKYREIINKIDVNFDLETHNKNLLLKIIHSYVAITHPKFLQGSIKIKFQQKAQNYIDVLLFGINLSCTIDCIEKQIIFYKSLDIIDYIG